MKQFIKAMDDLPKIVKILLCIPCLDIIWGIYRIVKGVAEENVLMVVVGVLWIIPGSFVCWIIDIVTSIISGRPTVLA